MRAKLVSESLSNILRPKTPEEVKQAIQNLSGNELLVHALSRKDIQLVKRALKLGVDKYGETTYYDHNPKVSLGNFLAKHGNSINDGSAEQSVKNDLLKKSIQMDFLQLSKYALSLGADVNFKDRYGSSPLYYAAKYQSLENVKLLLDNGADINVKNKDGWTPLMIVINPPQVGGYNQSPEVFKYLIDRGADVDIKTPTGKTAFDIASASGNKRIFRWIQENNLKKYDYMDLIRAISEGSIKSIKKIVEQGNFDLNKKIKHNSERWRPNEIEEMSIIDVLDFKHDKTALGKLKYLMSVGAKLTPSLIKKIEERIKTTHYYMHVDDNEKIVAKLKKFLNDEIG